MMHRVVHTDRPTYKVDDICKENLDHKNHSCILNIMRQKYYRRPIVQVRHGVYSYRQGSEARGLASVAAA